MATIRQLEIDIECYSSADLSKCGVYRYSEAPDFEILLFGYSADGGEVHVLDLAQGERIPADITLKEQRAAKDALQLHAVVDTPNIVFINCLLGGGDCVA